MKATLDEVEDQAKGIKTFWFQPARPLSYVAGQYIELTIPGLPIANRQNRRWFTLSSSPSEDRLAITTRLDTRPLSLFKSSLQRLKTGSILAISQPMGDFVLPKDATLPIVYIAGGIGITPLRSMVRWLRDRGQVRTIKLLYGVNRPEQAIFTDLFKSYGLHWVIQPSSQLSAEAVLRLAPDDGRQHYYLAGPEPMVDSLFAGMVASGIPERRLLTDYFSGYRAV